MKRTITALLAILVAIGMMVTFTGGVAAQGEPVEPGTAYMGERLLPASFNMEPLEAGSDYEVVDHAEDTVELEDAGPRVEPGTAYIDKRLLPAAVATGVAPS